MGPRVWHLPVWRCGPGGSKHCWQTHRLTRGRGEQEERVHRNCLSLHIDPPYLLLSIPLDFSAPRLTGRTVSNLLRIGRVSGKRGTVDALGNAYRSRAVCSCRRLRPQACCTLSQTLEFPRWNHRGRKVQILIWELWMWGPKLKLFTRYLFYPIQNENSFTEFQGRNQAPAGEEG